MYTYAFIVISISYICTTETCFIYSHKYHWAITLSFSKGYNVSCLKTYFEELPHHKLNSLTPGDLDKITKIFSLALQTGIFRSSYDNVIRWMPQDLTAEKSTLGQVITWCHQAPSHCLTQCWPSSMSPYGVTRPQWVNMYTYVNKSHINTLRHSNWPWTTVLHLNGFDFPKVHRITYLRLQHIKGPVSERRNPMSLFWYPILQQFQAYPTDPFLRI